MNIQSASRFGFAKFTLKKLYPLNIAYMLTIFVINSLFIYLPALKIGGLTFCGGDVLIGCVYVLRDLAQREDNKLVLVSMLIGCLLSYLCANKEIAIASAGAFFVGESIDYLIFSFTKRPLSERLLISSLISTPIDTIVFLLISNLLTPGNIIALILSKSLGVYALWQIWRLRYKSAVQH